MPQSPNPYFSCKSDRPHVPLSQVKEVNKTYSFNSEQVPLVHVDEGSCVQCSLKEADFLDADDLFGSTNICTTNLDSNGRLEIHVQNEFHAVVYCPQCSNHSTSCISKEHSLRNAASNFASPSVLDNVFSHKKDNRLNTSTVVMSCLVCFLIGGIIGVFCWKFFLDFKERRAEQRRRDLAYMLANSEVPFEDFDFQHHVDLQNSHISP